MGPGRRYFGNFVKAYIVEQYHVSHEAFAIPEARLP